MTISYAAQAMLKFPQYHVLRGENMPEWASYSIKEAADVTGYHPEYLRELCRLGRIESLKVGQAYLIRVESLEQYVKQMQETDDGRAGPRHPKR